MLECSVFLIFDGFPLTFCSHYWDAETGENNEFLGKGHTNQVSRMAVDESEQLVSCSMDDTVRYTSLSKKDYRYVCMICPKPFTGLLLGNKYALYNSSQFNSVLKQF